MLYIRKATLSIKNKEQTQKIQEEEKKEVIMASSFHVQISELSLVGFVVGRPFVRRRSAPDVSFQVEQLI